MEIKLGAAKTCLSRSVGFAERWWWRKRIRTLQLQIEMMKEMVE